MFSIAPDCGSKLDRATNRGWSKHLIPVVADAGGWSPADARDGWKLVEGWVNTYETFHGKAPVIGSTDHSNGWFPAGSYDAIKTYEFMKGVEVNGIKRGMPVSEAGSVVIGFVPIEMI